MSTQPFFIGRMTDPVVAHVLHLSALDFQVTKFLRDQIKNHTLSENDSVVLIADAHLNAKPSALRLLRRSITTTNIKIAGVFGDQAQMWAQYMEAPYLTEKPRMSMNSAALEQRRLALQNALQNEQQEELNVIHDIVNQAIDTVDKVEELRTQRTALLSFEQRQQQRVVDEPVAAPEATTVEGLRAALEQRKNPGLVEAATPEHEAVVELSVEPAPLVEDAPALDQELEQLLTPQAIASTVQNTNIPQAAEHIVVDQGSEPCADQTCEHLPVENMEMETIELSAEEQRLAEEEDRRFEQRQEESYVIRSSLKVETPCQSSLGQEHNSARQSVPEERIAVKPLRVRGRIRSGQTVRHPGDMIVEGSVHPSGEVAASGDIHVYGTGGGRLFAGIDGNSNACIYIAVFDAEIVSIAGHYHVIEDSYNNWSGRSIKISLEDGVLNFEEIRLMPQRAA